MGWSQYVMLGFGAFGAVAFPVLLVKAVQRREKHRIYEILVACVLLGWLVFQSLAPSAARHVPPTVHRAVVVVGVLFLLNMFGFSRWLFGRSRTPAV